MTNRETYQCPQGSCYSVTIIVEQHGAVVTVMCQYAHSFTVPLTALVRVEQLIDKSTSDGHHSFEELYRYRLLYNAALFNEWALAGLYDVHKSRHHHDGTLPFGDSKWFIVVAELPTGQISNHYRVVDWDLFDIETRTLPNVYDGHTPAIVAERLTKFLTKVEDRERLYVDSTLAAWAEGGLEKELAP